MFGNCPSWLVGISQKDFQLQGHSQGAAAFSHSVKSTAGRLHSHCGSKNQHYQKHRERYQNSMCATGRHCQQLNVMLVYSIFPQ